MLGNSRQFSILKTGREEEEREGGEDGGGEGGERWRGKGGKREGRDKGIGRGRGKETLLANKRADSKAGG